MVFSFTILDEVDSISSVDGIHRIAIFREPESYDSLSMALADVVKEVAELTSGLEIEGVHYNVRVVYMQLCVVIGIGKPSKYLTCISLSAIPVAVSTLGGIGSFWPFS